MSVRRFIVIFLAFVRIGKTHGSKNIYSYADVHSIWYWAFYSHVCNRSQKICNWKTEITAVFMRVVNVPKQLEKKRKNYKCPPRDATVTQPDVLVDMPLVFLYLSPSEVWRILWICDHHTSATSSIMIFFWKRLWGCSYWPVLSKCGVQVQFCTENQTFTDTALVVALRCPSSPLAGSHLAETFFWPQLLWQKKLFWLF